MGAINGTLMGVYAVVYTNPLVPMRVLRPSDEARMISTE